MVSKGFSLKEVKEVSKGAKKVSKERAGQVASLCKGPEGGLCLVCLRKSGVTGMG